MPKTTDDLRNPSCAPPPHLLFVTCSRCHDSVDFCAHLLLLSGCLIPWRDSAGDCARGSLLYLKGLISGMVVEVEFMIRISTGTVA